jgi:pSer/pThr/pTyr-binding forkhead associated (FHA) protein
MPRFLLQVKELGKAPRVLPIAGPMLVGRSRRADVVVDDEEVGREQFRLVLEGPALFIEGIGQTNRTTVDGAKLDAGQRAQLVAGAAIKVGRSTFLVQVGDATEGPPARPGAIDATLVAPRPSRPGDIPKPEEQTGGGSSPMGTMQMPRPGQGGNERATMPPKDGAADDAGMMTMPPKSYRPGQSPSAPPPASPPPAAPKPPTAPPEHDDPGMMTMPPKSYRPGQSPSAPPPASPPPAAPAASPAPPPPASNPPRSGAPKPTTVLVRVSELPPVAAQAGLSPAELEARLHQSLPRLVVKGEGLKRRIRLMKLRSRIGRAETADVLLPHETVSEQHAELQFDGAAWHLVDSGSANGTLVDGALLRAASQPIQRHTLLGFGNLRAVFLCNDAATAAEQRADERRAVQYLVKQGRLGRELAKQALQLVQKDQSQSLCEVLLMDTPIEAADWQLAIAATKGKLGFFARLLRLFSRRGGQNHSGGASGGGAGSGAGR